MGLPSLAMGVVPLLATRRSARAIGLDPNPRTVQVLRLLAWRELLVAVIFLVRRSPSQLWGFVGQDAMDLPLCGWMLATGRGRDRHRFRRACAIYVGLAVVDVYSAVTRNRGRLDIRRGGDVGR